MNREKRLEIILPEEIEKQSFSIIEEELGAIDLLPEEKTVLKRVIHTTADFEYATNLTFSPQVVTKAVQALREGAVIVSDTNMVKAGIHKSSLEKLGGEVFCYMADEEVAKEAKTKQTTRAVISMEKAARLHKKVIFAIGNAPTALWKLCDLYEEGLRPELVIGVPVGFVNVVESKERVMETFPDYIVAKGRKGGSNVAAAICNALIYMATNER